MEGAEMGRALLRSQSLVNKVLGDIPAVHRAYISVESLTLQPNSEPKNLDYMVTLLAIPSAPTLKAISADFTVEMCLSRMSEGLQIYQDLLKAIGDRVSSPEMMRDLQADIRDLLAQIHKMQQLGEMEGTGQYEGSGLGSRLSGDYELQVATHLTLVQLRDFTQDVFRSLRNLGHVKPGLVA